MAASVRSRKTGPEHDVRRANGERYQQTRDVVDVVLSVGIEADDDVIALAGGIAKTSTEGAAHPASLRPVEPFHVQLA
jgi:hypothetical protein